MSTVSTTTVTTTALSGCTLSRDVYNDGASFYLFAVEHLYCGLSLFRGGHLYKPETSLATSCWIEHHSCGRNGPRWSE
jgi:hypothetical protein